MRNKYQSKARKSMRKFEVVAGPELELRMPLPLAELWADSQAEVERMARETGLKIMLRILEDEVVCRVGPPHHWTPPPVVCAEENNRAMLFLVDRRFRWIGRGCARGKLKKWPWRVTASCSRRADAAGGAGTDGRGTFDAELPASGRECSRWLRDREE